MSDIIYGGHPGTDAVSSFAHEAPVRFLRSRGLSEKDVAGAGIIMTDAVLVYRSEAFRGGELTIKVAVDDIQQLGCDFLFRMAQKSRGKDVARAKTEIVFLDYEIRRPVPLPDECRSVCSLPRGLWNKVVGVSAFGWGS